MVETVILYDDAGTEVGRIRAETDQVAAFVPPGGSYEIVDTSAKKEAQAMAALRRTRTKYLAETDWLQIAQDTLSTEDYLRAASYRQMLRDLPETVTSAIGYVVPAYDDWTPSLSQQRDQMFAGRYAFDAALLATPSTTGGTSMLHDVDATIGALDQYDEVRIARETIVTYLRLHPLVAGMQALFGLDDATTDALFLAAMAIERGEV